MSDPSVNPLKRLIGEIHRRSLWQVLGIYVVASWAVLSVVDTVGGALNLPDWFPSFALALLIIGLPIVLATAFVQEGGQGQEALEPKAAPGDGAAPRPKIQIPSRLLTWRNALFGGVGALALWGVVAAGWLLFAGGLTATDDSATVVLSAVAEVDNAVDRGDWIEAFGLARALPPEIPDSIRATILSSVSRARTISSDPEGTTVSWRPSARPDLEWESLGTTPLEWDSPRVPIAVQFEREGYASRIRAGNFTNANVQLRRLDEVHADALHVPSRPLVAAQIEARLTHATPITLSEFLIDRYEVTNRQFKEFVDARGYEDRQFWAYPFERDGEVLTWEQAMAEFVDLTRRQGPSTWTGGTYPDGTADHPVTGVSWYEAAAYANFTGRDLPTVYHWYRAASPNAGEWIVPFSNFNGEGPAPVGEFPGVTPVGAYDMAGNAREWLANSTGDLRYTAGGGWNDPPYLFPLAQPQPPFDRSETNGLRLMTDLGDPAAVTLANQPVDFVTRDFYRETPVSDEVFAAFLDIYAYDDSPLNAQVEAVDTLEVGIRERITFDAGYGQERMVLYLFRPLESTGPLQTVVVFPGSAVLFATDFESGNVAGYVAMLVRSGRAVAYPIYKSTYERQDDYAYRLQDPSNDHRDHVIQWRQDLGRSLDYLQTRPEADSDRFGYFGSSWGGRMAAIMLAVEPRFRAAVLRVPGLTPLPTQPVVDPFNFVSRVQLPVLMMNGEYDQVYPLETAARPFFDLLGTDDTDKAHFIAPGGHTIPIVDQTRETLNWFDRYMGEVR